MHLSGEPYHGTTNTEHKGENTMRRGAAFALGLAALVIMPGLVGAENDWEYWSQYEVVWKAGDDIQLKLKPELRFRDDFSDHYYTHVEIGMNWSFRGWLVLAPSFRHISAESAGDWKTEKRPQADATLAWKAGGLSFSDRNRLEYRVKTGRETVRYRNRFWVKFPRMGPAGIQAFLGEEVFYDFDADEFNKNRAYAGFDVGLVRRLIANVYYIMDSSRKNDGWARTNMLATALKYRF